MNIRYPLYEGVYRILTVESEYQAAEDAEKYRRRYQKAGDFIEEPEESPETDDGDCRPYR